MKAILRGMKTRFEVTGNVPILIHTVRTLIQTIRWVPFAQIIIEVRDRREVSASVQKALRTYTPKGAVADYYAGGRMTDETIHSDLDIADIESVPIKPFNHREVDIEIVKADGEGSWHSTSLPPATS